MNNCGTNTQRIYKQENIGKSKTEGCLTAGQVGERQKAKTKNSVIYMSHIKYEHIAIETLVKNKTRKMKTNPKYNSPLGGRRTIHF